MQLMSVCPSHTLLQVKITRTNTAEGEDCPHAYAPRYPGVREEGWWVLLTSMRSNQVLSYGHVTQTGRVCEKELKVSLSYYSSVAASARSAMVFCI
jgi:hypothetical protein